uniref:transposase n=1 Tax=Roseovarius salinarum TaxID=1981892 RepID=UPI001E31B752
PPSVMISTSDMSTCLGISLSLLVQAHVSGRKWGQFTSVLLTDRGYDADSIRKKMETRDVLTQIPMRKSRKMRVGVDHSLYSLRNLVERCFNKLKNARRVATRYDKPAESFLGFIDITFI